MLLLTPFGGSIADRYEHRTVIRTATQSSPGLAGLLAVQAIAGWHQAWVLYVIVAIASSVMALRNPAGEAVLPLLLSHARRLLGAISVMLLAVLAAVLSPPAANAADTPIETMPLWRLQVRVTGSGATNGFADHPAFRFNSSTTGIRTLNPQPCTPSTGRKHRIRPESVRHSLRDHRCSGSALPATTTGAPGRSN